MTSRHDHNHRDSLRSPDARGTRSFQREDIPTAASTGEDLHLWFPSGSSRKSVERNLCEMGIRYQAVEAAQALIVPLGDADLPELAVGLGAGLGRDEKIAIRALVMPAGVEPGYRDFGRVMTLLRLLALSSASWLIEMLGQMRLTAHFQSIVHANLPERRFAREGLLRGLDRNGALYAPGGMFQVASDADLLVQLDLAARRTVIGEVARHGLTGERTFFNIMPASIYDPVTSLRSTVDTIDEAGIPRENIIFEIAQPGRTEDRGRLRDILEFCREEGFGVALDGIGLGASDLELMARLRPDYIKLAIEVVRDVDRDDYHAAITGRLLEVAGELGIRSIAVGVETLGELDWLREHGADYIQGYLIDRPEPFSE